MKSYKNGYKVGKWRGEKEEGVTDVELDQSRKLHTL